MGARPRAPQGGNDVTEFSQAVSEGVEISCVQGTRRRPNTDALRSRLLPARLDQRPRLLDNLIRPQQQRRRDGEAEGLGGLEVYEEFKLDGLVHRQVGRLRAFENLVHKRRGAPAGVV